MFFYISFCTTKYQSKLRYEDAPGSIQLRASMCYLPYKLPYYCAMKTLKRAMQTPLSVLLTCTTELDCATNL